MREEKIHDWTQEDLLEVLKEIYAAHLQPEIRSIVKEELAAERTAFWVPAERHYNEHRQLEKCVKSAEEKDANHEFVSSMRKRGNKAGEVAFYLAVVASCTWAAATFWGGFMAALQKLLKPGGG